MVVAQYRVFTEANNNYFQLHEEIRDLLLADARRRNLLDKPEIIAIHKALANYYLSLLESRTHSPYPLEAAYHTIMANIGLEKESGIPRETFWNYLSGSSSLTIAKKLKITQAPLTSENVQGLVKILQVEITEWEQLLGERLAKALRIAIRNGKASSITDISFWV